MDLDYTQLAALLGIVVGLGVAAVTKSTADSRVKSLVAAVGVVAAAVVAWLVSDSAPDSVTLGGIVNVAVFALIGHLGSYKYALKPLGVTEAVSRATDHTPMAFIGTPPG